MQLCTREKRKESTRVSRRLTLAVKKRGTLVSLEGSRERHHGDPIGDQLGPVVAQPVLQLAHSVLLLRTVTLDVLASFVVSVIALRHCRVVGTILVAAV